MSGYTPNVPRWAGCEELWGAAALQLAQRADVTAGVNIFRWPEDVPQIEALKRAGCIVKARKTLPGLARLGPQIPGRLRSRWLNRFAPDLAVITQHQFQTDPEWAERCRSLHLPYVLNVQAVDETVSLDESERRLLAANYQQARRCYFVAGRNRAAVETALGVRLENAAVIRNPFKVPHYDPPPYPEAADGLSLACVARLDHVKGHDLLIEILAQEKWRARALRVDCYGTGSLETALAGRVRELGLQSLRFCGFRKDVRGVWAGHHALILPSRAEGLPLSIVEAMLCERACIVTDVGGNADLLQEARTGFIAPTATTADLDAALERAWARRTDLAAMGRAAGAHARKVIPADPGAEFARELLSLLHAED